MLQPLDLTIPPPNLLPKGEGAKIFSSAPATRAHTLQQSQIHF
jgi:hypothetical protein